MEKHTSGNDPIYIADCVMGCLVAKGIREISIVARNDGVDFPFTLQWSELATGKDSVSVNFADRLVLRVNFFMLDEPLSLDEDVPLKEQALHKVEVFEDGPWSDILLGALEIASENNIAGLLSASED